MERVKPGPEIRFGASFARGFRDQQARRLVWFAVGRQLVSGERYGLRATVKRHDCQRGEAVTVLARSRWECTAASSPAAEAGRGCGAA